LKEVISISQFFDGEYVFGNRFTLFIVNNNMNFELHPYSPALGSIPVERTGGLSLLREGLLQLFIDGGATESNGVIYFKPSAYVPDLTCPGYLFNQFTAGHRVVSLIIVAISFSATAAEAARHCLGLRTNGLNPDITQQEFEVVVGVSETVSHLEIKAINKYMLSILAEGVATRLVDSMVYPMDVEVVEIVVLPAQGDLDDLMQFCQGGCSGHTQATPDHRTDPPEGDFK